MSQVGKDPDPLRRRAGLLSALSRIYNEAYRLMKNGGTPEEVEQLRAKIEDGYNAHLEGHEVTLVEYPDREQTLVESHDAYDLKHQLLLDQLTVYVERGAAPEDKRSVYAASLFSQRSSAKNSIARSCPVPRKAHTFSRQSKARSTTLSETRVQAELAKRRFAQQKAEAEEHQRKIEFDRDIARQHRELDKRRAETDAREKRLQEDAARKLQELNLAAEERERQVQLAAQRNQEELEIRQRQIQLDFEKQQRELQEKSTKRKQELDLWQRELHEEAELYERHMEKVMQMQKKQNEMENLQAELRLREREEIRNELGSDYDSDDDRVDVTQTKMSAKPKSGFQPETDQEALMQQILRDVTDDHLPKPMAHATTRNAVTDWLNDPANEDTSHTRVPKTILATNRLDMCLLDHTCLTLFLLDKIKLFVRCDVATTHQQPSVTSCARRKFITTRHSFTVSMITLVTLPFMAMRLLTTLVLLCVLLRKQPIAISCLNIWAQTTYHTRARSPTPLETLI